MEEKKGRPSDVKAQAEELLEQCAPDKAVKLLRKALKQNSRDTGLIDLLAQALLEMGHPAAREEALALLKRSVEISPDDSSTKWMYLGQIQAGMEAAKCLQKGVDIMQREYKTANEAGKKEEAAEMLEEISRGYCSIAELYVTDLCDEDNAESECERLLQLAVQTGPKNPEAFYGLGNLRLIQSKQAQELEDEAAVSKRESEAKQCALRCVELVKEADEADDNAEETEEVSYNTRLNIAKLTLELGLLEESQALLERLTEIDDQVVETWYLLGTCYMEQRDAANARNALMRAKLILTAVFDPDLEDLQAAVEERLSQLPSEGMEEDEEEMDNENEEQENDDDDEDDEDDQMAL